VQNLHGMTRRGIVALLALAGIVGPASARAAALPDQRGYELVSPADKNGGDVRTVSSRSYVASDGNAMVFPSYVGFGDVHGTQIDTDYLAERTGTPGTQGWSTHGITPRQGALSFYVVGVVQVPTNFEPVFTPDLASGVFRVWRTLTDAPNVEQVLNLYRIGGLRGGTRGTTLMSDAFAPLPPLSIFFLSLVRPAVVGASTDLSHIVFESEWQLTSDAPPYPERKLYDFAGGTLHTAGVLPDGTAATGEATTVDPTAFGAYPVPHTVSGDGSHVFFTAIDPSTGNQNVYVRIDGTTTEQINMSEKAVPESPVPAALWNASADGSRAFFLTNEGLVDGDDDGSADLYMYDETAPPGARLTRIGSADGVIGASDDGRYVYFVANGSQINVWHDGTVSFVGNVSGAFDDARVNEPVTRYILGPDVQRSRLAPDGRHLLFMARDDAGHEGLYVYSADSGRLACASCNPSGRPATDDALDYVWRGPGVPTWHLSHALSDDGRWVFFNTGEALVPEDANGKIDAYEYDVANGTVHLLSSGSDPNDSFFVEASSSGRDAFIATRQRLVGWDRDDNYDIYVVRVDGGFPEPPPPTSACAGEACQGAPGTAPSAGPAGSSVFRGAGDLRERLHAHAKPKKHRHKARHKKRAKRRAKALKQRQLSPRYRGDNRAPNPPNGPHRLIELSEDPLRNRRDAVRTADEIAAQGGGS
jgi:hypothetical protein